MRTFVVIFHGVYKNTPTGRKSLGDLEAKVPIYGFFLRFRQKEMLDYIESNGWPMIREKLRGMGKPADGYNYMTLENTF